MKKPGKIAAVLTAIIAALIVIFIIVYNVRKNNLTVSVNGTNMTGKTAEQIAGEFADEFEARKVTVADADGTEELTGTMNDFGYTVSKDNIQDQIAEQMDEQTGSFFATLRSIGSGVQVTVDLGQEFDENKFRAFCVSSSFSTPRVAYTAGSVDYDEATSSFGVTEAVQGNEIDDAKMQSYVEDELKKAVGSGESEVTITLPEDVYLQGDVSEENEKLKKEADAFNAYAGSRVIYTFGDETETLDGSTFKDWLNYDESSGSVSIDDSKLQDYVAQLAAKYDTRWLTRTFTTTGGQTITFSSSKNEYGYTIDQDAEAEQLKEDLASKTEVTREPVYKKTNEYGNPVYLKRNGTDDLAGTYVEIDLTKQHLWFYKDGSLVIESDLVSGDISKGLATDTGVFYLAYKKSPSTLTGSQNGYATNVTYWMPFYEGEGMHDGWWRSEFGGSVYETNGSHGCVNLPTATAETIYNNIDPGTAIIVYQEPGDPNANVRTSWQAQAERESSGSS